MAMLMLWTLSKHLLTSNSIRFVIRRRPCARSEQGKGKTLVQNIRQSKRALKTIPYAKPILLYHSQDTYDRSRPLFSPA